ncbi:MAG TPA: putative baseplate assembly protein [Actinocrinis sp.]|uniref:putative baseplate assembly protein n=1 Tax=Actinocrinis sp. TaxID=1920516 RepID=UPI002DDD7101|nr:putative baseplate assembly protein [Actinocrinis sp.]HEV2344286.1 putative baseplate assembly protein [Actinocrinis sp.]
MPLPAPDLDDRRFQDFVDDAKRLLRRRVPAWSDHNVHDPGITLIEAVATIADQLAYRLNQVPERHHRKFLDLLGITRRPPSAARADLTFKLSAPRPDAVVIPAGHRVGTPRLPGEEPVGFATLAQLRIVPVSLTELRAAPAVGSGQAQAGAGANAPDRSADNLRDLRPLMRQGEPAACFSPVPQPGDRLYVGLSDAAPSCLVSLRTDSRVEGIGVDPDHPPLYWEAYQASGWARCTVERDTTGGLNRPGEILLHLPPEHTHCLINGVRAAWLRAVVAPPQPKVPAYSKSPTLTKLTAACMGGTVAAVHAEHITNDVLGTAEGAAGQRFRLHHAPVLPGSEPAVIEVSSEDGWLEWHQVTDFAGSGRDDRHYTLDPMTGDVEFGPAVRLADGSVRCHGKVPPEGTTVRMRGYWTGGGAVGNVGAGRLTVMRSAIPYVSSVTNRLPARGGHDGESVAEAKVRAGLALRGQDRAVTAEDYEAIATRAVSGAARVRCVPPPGPNEPVHVLVVPDVSGYGPGRIPFDALTPDEPSMAAIADALEQRRLIGVRIAIEPPRYQGVTAAVRLRSRRTEDLEEVRTAAVAALYRWLHPREGGPDGAGWPFGRAVTLGDVHAALAAVPGADYVEEARLYPADPTTGARGESAATIELGPDMLPFSYDHQVRVS